jgi:hypothetical protein
MQHHITQMVENHLARVLLPLMVPNGDHPDAAREAKRLSSVADRNASSFLRTAPSSYALRLNDFAMGISVRLRLGLPVSERLPSCCTCKDSSRLDVYGDHLFTCRSGVRQGPSIARHNLVVQALNGLFRDGGISTMTELSYHNQQQANSGIRPDIEAVSFTTIVSIDVTVTHPASAGHSKCADPIARVEALKRSKYEAFTASFAPGKMFHPFGLDTWGKLGSDALQVVKWLVREAGHHFPLLDIRAFRAHAIATINMALHRGNALLISDSLQAILFNKRR